MTNKTPVLPGQVWQHHSGIIYKVLMITNTEGDGTVREKYPPTVVYQGVNGKCWSGRLDDWCRRMTLVQDVVNEDTGR